MRKVLNLDFTCLTTIGIDGSSAYRLSTSLQKLSIKANQPSPQENPQHIAVCCGDK
jgi:hypothetical protein